MKLPILFVSILILIAILMYPQDDILKDTNTKLINKDKQLTQHKNSQINIVNTNLQVRNETRKNIHSHEKIRHARQSSKSANNNAFEKGRYRTTPIDNVGLSEQQKAHYKAALSTYNQQRKSLANRRREVSPQTFSEQFKEIKSQYLESLAELMNEQQYAKYNENMDIYNRTNQQNKNQRKQDVQENRDIKQSRIRG